MIFIFGGSILISFLFPFLSSMSAAPRFVSSIHVVAVVALLHNTALRSWHTRTQPPTLLPSTPSLRLCASLQKKTKPGGCRGACIQLGWKFLPTGNRGKTGTSSSYSCGYRKVHDQPYTHSAAAEAFHRAQLQPKCRWKSLLRTSEDNWGPHWWVRPSRGLRAAVGLLKLWRVGTRWSSRSPSSPNHSVVPRAEGFIQLAAQPCCGMGSSGLSHGQHNIPVRGAQGGTGYLELWTYPGLNHICGSQWLELIKKTVLWFTASLSAWSAIVFPSGHQAANGKTEL